MNSIIVSSVVKLSNNPHYNNNSKHKHKPNNNNNNEFLTYFNREVERIKKNEEYIWN